MQNHPKKALIIGCGIAGPTLALFLKRAGIESEIYEAREALEGYSLSLASNGVAVLQMLSLDDLVLKEGSAITKFMMWSGKSKLLGRGILANGDLKSVFIKRVPLGMILADEAERQGIKIMWGKKLQDIKVTSTGGVVASFDDGTIADGDLLIGCDGVHSRTRQSIDSTIRPTYTGIINTGGYTSSIHLPNNTPETLHFIAGKRAFFGYNISTSGYIYWFVNYFQSKEPTRESLREITSEELRELLLEMFREDQPFIGEIIGAADSIFSPFLSYVLPRQPIWYKGPVVLVGDAVHAISPSSGQGAAMALEDAVVLAKCLRDLPDLEQAFTTYEQLRRERTTKMFDFGQRGDSGKFVTGSVQQWFRDVSTPIFLKLFANPEASAWIYSYRVTWDEPIKPQSKL